MATDNGRTAEQVRLDIEAERERLAAALEDAARRRWTCNAT